ncbi:MAG TPA: phosphatase [Cytophagales bacterium]|jgi:3',5'-cyclic AMP phosphodiesterase CpdA|nr:phosphatase [Cytophagales bacterium]
MSLKIGIFADPQYCNRPEYKNRYYKNSLNKIEQMIDHFKAAAVDHIICLGDLIDRDFESFEPVMSIISASKLKFNTLAGNHDFEIAGNNKKARVLQALKMPEPYYQISLDRYRILFLDGNEISAFANPPESTCALMAEEWIDQLQIEQQPNGQIYNGGIGAAQFTWLNAQLKDSFEKAQFAIVCCHYPVYPKNKHNLLNDEALLHTLAKYSNVRLFLAGHNHEGAFGQYLDSYFITLPGMVETYDENAYAIMCLGENTINIKGFGRVPDYNLNFE